MITKQKLVFLLAVLFIGTLLFSGCIENGDAVTYKVIFKSTWSEETHPDDFPPNPHFSGLIGASHNDKVSFWKEGKLASLGIKNMAETGSKDPLTNYINDAISDGTAYKLLSGNGIGSSPGSTSLFFKVKEEYPLVTLVTMIAPSPDWFVGVDSLNLFENGAFVDKKAVTLYAYDSGTDNGSTYKSPNNPIDLPVPIFKIEGYPFLYDEQLVPLGIFTFIKI